MIVFIKNEIARILNDSMSSVKMRTSRFNERTSNKSQRDLEVNVYHVGDTFVRVGKNSYIRNYRYRLEISVKNLRTDDEIQDIADLTIYSLLAASISGNHEIIIESDDSQEIDEQSIWRYTIDLYVSVPTNKDTINCDLTKEYSFDSIMVNIYPSYDTPLASST